MATMEPLWGGAVWKTTGDCGLGFGGCLQFDGVDDRVSVTYSSSLDLTTAMTLSLWIKLPSIPTDDRRILHKAESYFVRTNPAGESPRISAFIKSGGLWEPRISLPTADEKTNNWMHLTITYNATGGTNNFKLYKDGALKAQTTRTGNIDVSAYNLSIGASEIGTLPISALIDEVAIYNQALTAYQIQRLYAQGVVRKALAIR